MAVPLWETSIPSVFCFFLPKYNFGPCTMSLFQKHSLIYLLVSFFDFYNQGPSVDYR
jgi:hypothetical protein